MPHRLYARFRPVLVAAVTVAVALAITDAVKVVLTRRAAPSDYVQDYLSARQLRDGLSLYAPAPENPAVAPVIDPARPRSLVNDHPPTYILALAPLSGLSYGQAFVILGLSSVLVTVAAGWLVGREVGLPTEGRWAVVTVLFWHPGTDCCLAVGNLSLLLLGLIAAGWVAVRRGLTSASGLALGMAATVKLFPALLVVGLLAARRWRAATASVGAALVFGGLAVAILGPGDFAEYGLHRAKENARQYRDHGYNLSWTAAAYRTLGEPNPEPPVVTRVAVLPEWARVADFGGRGLIVAGLLLALVLSSTANRTPDRLFALLIPAMLLLSPITWGHALPMTVIPIAVLARPCWRAGWAHFAALLTAATAMFGPGPGGWRFVLGPIDGAPPVADNLLALSPTAGLLVLGGLAASWLLRPDASIPEAPLIQTALPATA